MDPLREDAIHHERQVKIVCVGAGASGLCLAYKLRRSFTNIDLTIYEKNPEVGGTWYENRYPGCACDVPAHNYTFSFESKPDFSSVLSPSAEIREYFDDFANKYDLRRHVRLSHAVRETAWDRAAGQWKVTVEDLATGEVVRDWCHILVHATGYLNKASWPKIPGLELFKGPKLHSASWDESVSLAGKKVLLVGSGASAVQILPAVQPIVKSATVFARTPRWSLPGVNSKKGRFSADEIARFVENPQLVMDLRLQNERVLNSFFTMYMKGTPMQKQARSLLTAEMKKVLVDPEAQAKMVPDFAVGCKRILPSGDAFLHATKNDNVEVVYAGVKAFTETGCVSDDGQAHDGDVIVCATGFDTSFVPRYPVLFGGRNLQEDWATTITGYMGVGIAECPNAFTMGGPWTPISNGPVLTALEAQADFVCAFVDKYQTEPALLSVRLKAAASLDFRAQVAHMTKKMVWADACRNAHNVRPNWGQPSITWPGSTLHYLEALRDPRFEDYEYEYAANRFAWLGDGVSQTEWDPTADLGYYIRDVDDGRHLSKAARLREMSKSGSMPARELHRQEKLMVAEALEDEGIVPGGELAAVIASA